MQLFDLFPFQVLILLLAFGRGLGGIIMQMSEVDLWMFDNGDIG